METQIAAPIVVYNENFVKFILAKPAGNEMKCLTPGSNLPINVVISPCFSKYFSDFDKEFEFKKKKFSYFNISLLTAALPI